MYHSGGGAGNRGGGAIGEICVLSARFCSEFKTALESEVHYNSNKKGLVIKKNTLEGF